MPGGADFNSTYSNLFYLSAEKRAYNFSRGDDKSPNFMVSSDEGNAWTYGGQLTRPDSSIGYVNGYFKYASDGVDRIHFTGTEFHPRDFNTSLYHGYVQGGKSYNSAGQVVDSDLSDKVAPLPTQFTPVFKANTTVAGVQMTRCWNIDLQAYPSGELGFLFKCRAGNSETDHRFLHARLFQGQWTVRYLARAGAKLFSAEQDYTGLGALDPKSPSTLYISTAVDPVSNQALENHEIFKGVTSDAGVTWTWTALTRQSTRDNFRPVVPIWEGGGTALIWFRGTMTSSQSYDCAMVGLFLPDSSQGVKTYVDGTPQNTRLATGGPLAPTGPAAAMGVAEGQWHQRSGFGNGGSVYTSAEAGAEDAPVLRTTVPGLPAGTYDVWAHFWANPTSDWRLKAGLRMETLQVYRSMAARRVEAGEHSGTVILSGTGGVQLYEAYLGRVTLASGDSLAALVDDHAIRTGTADSLVGDVSRTWYDGISWRQVGTGPTSLKPANRGNRHVTPGYGRGASRLRDLKGRSLETSRRVR